MQLSPTSLALSLLKYDPTMSVRAAHGAASDARRQMENQVYARSKQALQAEAPDPYVPQPVFNYPAFMTTLRLAGRMVEASEKGRNGEVSPFDGAAAKAAAGRTWQRLESDPRMDYEGVFPASASVAMGTTAPRRDADFPARRDAMAYAYSFGSRLAVSARQAVADSQAIRANRDRMLDGTGQLHGVARDGRLLGSWEAMAAADAHQTHDIVANMFNMEVQAASLANLFSFDSASVTAPAYRGEFNGFSIRHGRLGPIMDVAADGAITLHGADGTAHRAADYSAAQVDGGIPQLRNDLIRAADRQKLVV